MGINRSIILIIVSLVISIIVAIIYQVLFVISFYENARMNLDDEYTHILNNVIQEYSLTTRKHELSFSLLKAYNFESDEKTFKEEALFFKQNSPNNFKLTHKDLDTIYGRLKKEVANHDLNTSYEIDYHWVYRSQKYDSIYQQSDILLIYDCGIFSFKLKEKRKYIFSEIKYIVFSSIIIIITIIVCVFLLVKKYFTEKKLNSFKNKFINNLTHELQTPITIAGLALEKLDIELNNNPKLHKYASIAKKENDKIGTLSKRILKLAKLTSTDFQSDVVDIEKSINEIVSRYDLVLKSNDIIQTEYNHQSINIVTDSEQFTDLIDNLISNAVKYSKSPREIIIKTFLKNKKLVITIEDNGIGIPKEFSNKIFSPFFTVSYNDTHEIKSHGLGLSYVAEIIKRMNGSISFTSKANKGTKFNIEIPYEN